MQTIWQWILDNFQLHQWLFEVIAIIFFTLIAFYAERFIHNRLYKRLKKTKKVWDDALLSALHKPLRWLIWFVGLSFLFCTLLREINYTGAVIWVDNIRSLAVIVFFLWGALSYTRELEARISRRKRSQGDKAKETTVHAVSQIMRILVFIIAGLSTMQLFGIPLSGIVAFGGVGALAVSFAAKDTLANFFGGFMVYWDRPFEVGDWIRSPDRNIEGTVELIGWRLTMIRTFDKRPLYVPNSMFSTISVENPSRMSNRRIRTVIGVRYDDFRKIGKIVSAVEDMLRNNPDIDTEQTCFVKLIEFGPSSLNFLVYTFTKTVDWVEYQAIQQDVFLKILDIINANGAECAFPTTTMHIPDGIKLGNLDDGEKLHGSTTTN